MDSIILGLLSQADTIGGIVTLFFIAVYSLYIGFKETKKLRENKNKKNSESNFGNNESDSNDISPIEKLSDTYIEIIKQLRREVQSLKNDMEELSKLRDDNAKMTLRVSELESINKKQEQEIKKLSAKIKRLENRAEAARKPVAKKSRTKNKNK